jgi:hypothetical protein
VIAGTATAVSNRVSRRQANRWAAQEEQPYQQSYQQQAYPQPVYAQPAYAPPPPASDANEMDAKIEQLARLGDLKKQGVLSEAEFEVQKAQVLRS